jgi:uncharacterized membrane protein YGL010W
MKTIHNWLDEYAVSHQNPTNKLIHWICVPSIMLSLLGLLWAIPVPGFIAAISPLLNWATVFVAFALGYYLMLSPKLAVGMLPVVVVMMIVNYAIWLQVGGWIWLVAVIIFFVAWVGQFWGHKIEGKKPSFLKDLQFLLIGPLWLLSFIYQRAGLSY